MNPVRRPALLIVLAIIAAASLFLALLFGSLELSLAQVADALLFDAPGLARAVIVDLRLPRALAAFACGGLLAAAGVLLQVLLRNPLADPYILGVSSGAALGALAALAAGASLALTHVAALAGALAAIAIVFGLSFHAGDWNLHRLLLTGVVLSAGLSSLISLILVIAPQAQLRGMLFWLMGDLGYADEVSVAWVVLAIVLVAGLVKSQALDVLTLGALKAQSLGVAVLPLQIGIYFGAALATVAAVLLGGSIGFVGLMVPHALRLIGIADHRYLLPGAVLLGGSFVAAADTLARTLFAPQQLPVGVVTALAGVPVMLILLSGRR